MLKLIDRYVAKECALTTAAVIAVLLVILLGSSLVRVLGRIAEGKLPEDALWMLLTINLVHYLVILVPIGLYLGILLGMGRLYKDSEMAALFACGIGSQRLYRGILALTLPLVMLSIGLSLYLAPWTAAEQDRIKHAAQNASPISGLVAGQFNESANGKQTLFFERFAADERLLQQVFAQTRETEQNTVQAAKNAVVVQTADQDPYLVLQQGYAYRGTPGQLDYRTTEFAAYGVQIRQNNTTAVRLRTSATPSAELWRATEPKQIAEWQWRLSIPLVCLLLALLALPLSYTSPRKGRFAKLGVGILVYIIYSNMLGVARAWVERDAVPPWLGLWWVHVAVILIWLLLLTRPSISWLPRLRFKARKET